MPSVAHPFIFYFFTFSLVEFYGESVKPEKEIDGGGGRKKITEKITERMKSLACLSLAFEMRDRNSGFWQAKAS